MQISNDLREIDPNLDPVHDSLPHYDVDLSKCGSYCVLQTEIFHRLSNELCSLSTIYVYLAWSESDNEKENENETKQENDSDNQSESESRHLPGYKVPQDMYPGQVVGILPSPVVILIHLAPRLLSDFLVEL